MVAACLRNAAAVARYLGDFDRIALVPAGERLGDGSLRPAYEDLVGAGAVVDRLSGRDPGVRLAPEAEVAALAFRALRPLESCPSGAELVEKGFAEDVRIASEVDVTSVVPALVEGRFVPARVPAALSPPSRTGRRAGAEQARRAAPAGGPRWRDQQLFLPLEQVGERRVDALLAAGRQPDAHSPAVGRVGLSVRPGRGPRAGRPGWSWCPR